MVGINLWFLVEEVEDMLNSLKWGKSGYCKGLGEGSNFPALGVWIPGITYSEILKGFLYSL